MARHLGDVLVELPAGQPAHALAQRFQWPGDGETDHDTDTDRQHHQQPDSEGDLDLDRTELRVDIVDIDRRADIDVERGQALVIGQLAHRRGLGLARTRPQIDQRPLAVALDPLDEVGDDMLAVGRGQADQILALEGWIAGIGQRYPVQEIGKAIVLAIHAEPHDVQILAQGLDGLVAGQFAGLDLTLQIQRLGDGDVVDRLDHGGPVVDQLMMDEIECDRSRHDEAYRRQDDDRQQLGANSRFDHSRILPNDAALIRRLYACRAPLS